MNSVKIGVFICDCGDKIASILDTDALENEARVPFMLRVPGHGRGESRAVVQPQDVFATVTSIAGKGDLVPPGVESYDLLEEAEGGAGRRSLALTGGTRVT